MPASRWPGIRQAYSNSAGLGESPDDFGFLASAERVLPFGSSCSMSGFFFICSACLSSPRCRQHEFVRRARRHWSRTNRICSPRLHLDVVGNEHHLAVAFAHRDEHGARTASSDCRARRPRNVRASWPWHRLPVRRAHAEQREPRRGGPEIFERFMTVLLQCSMLHVGLGAGLDDVELGGWSAARTACRGSSAPPALPRSPPRRRRCPADACTSRDPCSRRAAMPSRTFTTENMPPISIGPNWPNPVIIGSVLSGIGISISPISAMPAEPIGM